MTDYDTIAAISTPPGEGGISIVRLSGSQSLAIADRLYKMGHKKLAEQPTHTIHYGHIYDPTSDEMLDEVMVTVMRAPKTYTREDIVEINTHGGIIASNAVLQAALRQGARLAEPGEFTKRAFLNGRIDLSQAEAINDVIEAKTDASMHNAIKQLDGSLAHLIRSIRKDIFDVLGQVEVNIDYPEYDDVEEVTSNFLMKKTKALQGQIRDILNTSKQGRILRSGLRTAIIGRPNVGKSSLLNRILREDRAIVTEVAGTTRDVVEDFVNVRGVPLRLIDTAGIRDTEDIVEKIGVERSRKALDDAEFVLLVINQSEPLTDEDLDLIEISKHKQRVVILNKTDLDEQIDREKLQAVIGDDLIIETSAVNNQGIDKLEQAIADIFFEGHIESPDATYISNTRQIAHLNAVDQSLDDVIAGLEAGMPVDLVQIDVTNAWQELGEITGDTYKDELLDELFSNFCLGK